MRIATLLILLVESLLSLGPVAAEAELGIAAQYPGDVGLKQDPDVVFFWDYENESDWRSGWDGGLKPYVHVTDPENVFSGAGAIAMNLIAGTNGVGDVIRLPHGYPCVYQRWYAKYPVGFETSANGFKLHGLGGVAPDLPNWWPQGKAGIPPNGEDKLYCILGYLQEGLCNFYYYHPHQKGPWGDVTKFDAAGVLLGKWVCRELMLKINDVGQKNGELKCWVDGTLVGQVEGLEWRTVATLELNLVFDHVYNAVPKNETVWMDNRVVATKYIGPLQAGKAPKTIEKPALKPVVEAAPAKPAIDAAPDREALVQALQHATIDRAAETEITLLGKIERVRVSAVDTKGIVASFGKNTLPIRWENLSSLDFAKIAVTHLSGDAQALYHAGVLATAEKDTGLREQILSLLWTLDVARAKDLKDLR